MEKFCNISLKIANVLKMGYFGYGETMTSQLINSFKEDINFLSRREKFITKVKLIKDSLKSSQEFNVGSFALNYDKKRTSS